MNELSTRKCKPCERGGDPLPASEAGKLLEQLDGWKMTEDAKQIHRTFEFKDYYRTMAFVNAVAWIAHREDHHPDLVVGYNRCTVRYSTHAVGGLSENDFICAAKVEALLVER